mgnify:CR=1 FL=1
MFTLGDPAGVGPEIVARYLSEEFDYTAAIPVVVGDYDIFMMAHTQFDLKRPIARLAKGDATLLFKRGENDSDIRLQAATLRDQVANAAADSIRVVDIDNLLANDLKKAQVQTEAGRSAGIAIDVAIQAARLGAVDAVVTAPIHKVSFRAAGYTQYPGHTEMFGEQLTEGGPYCMMLVCGGFSVCHVSLHTALRDAIDKDIKQDRILDVIKLAHEHGKRLGAISTDSSCKQGTGKGPVPRHIVSPRTVPADCVQSSSPKIGVCALNPHGGEGGLFGREEIDEIMPAVEAAQAEGINVTGPLPSDTVFIKAKAGMFDYVIAMYHDQGHIAAKMEGFFVDEQGNWTVEGINVTVGLPIIRTSVDHGTAFDIAWQGIASTASLHDATRYALDMIK